MLQETVEFMVSLLEQDLHAMLSWPPIELGIPTVLVFILILSGSETQVSAALYIIKDCCVRITVATVVSVYCDLGTASSSPQVILSFTNEH